MFSTMPSVMLTLSWALQRSVPKASLDVMRSHHDHALISYFLFTFAWVNQLPKPSTKRPQNLATLVVHLFACVTL